MGKVKSAKGKSKKSTWKKIAHPDVDSFLVEQRREERQGVVDKPNAELFFVDQLGFDDDFSQLSAQKREAQLKRHTRSKTGPLVDLTELTCLRILKPDSNVKDPRVKRNTLKKGGGRKTLDMKLKDEIRAYKQATTMAPPKKTGWSDEVKTLDLWATTVTDSAQNKILSNDWLTETTKRNLLRRSTHKPNRSTNEIKQIEVPHPGLSYNPSFLDHQAILQEAIQTEKAKIKAEQKVVRATHIPHQSKIEIADLEIKSEPESESDYSTERKELILSKQTKPKTKATKRKEREQHEQMLKIKQKKIKSKLESDVFRVKSLKKEIEQAEIKTKTRLSKRIEKIKLREKYGVKTLSRFKFEELKPEPVLSEDLVAGLRGATSTGGDLLLDRFKSLQKRNVIEPRVKQTQKRKNRRKKYTRDCDKMEWEKTGLWNGEKINIDNTAHRRKYPARR